MQISSLNPATGEILEEFANTGPADVERAVARAARAQTSWAKDKTARKQGIKDLGAVLSDRAGEIAALITLETGKVTADAEAEVAEVIDAVDHYLACLEETTARPIAVPADVFPATDVSYEARPVGVIGMIMPWNFPFYTPMMCLIPCLLAGNAAVLKPSEYATLCGRLILELTEAAGLPQDLVQLVPGDGDTGQALVRSHVDRVFFVGSRTTGRSVVAHAGLTPVHYELGGNSAAVVLSDADLDLTAAAIAWGAAYHSGQDCAAVKRVYAEAGVAEALIDRLAAVLGTLTPGVDYGPYIRRPFLDLAQRRTADAVASGSRLVTGGQRLSEPHPNGNWLAPALVELHADTVPLVMEETFGNVIPVLAVPDADSAVRHANSSRQSLSASVFTSDTGRARSLAEELEAAMVFVNDPFVNLPGADHWTGWNDSGSGSMESRWQQCHRKRVLSVHSSSRPRDFWFGGAGT
ncbi:aldehyde dehydrogenase family protein [Streptomyces sp. NBC_01465]|uniref:aldehyde dehydrogenase family protein n=1 Tax=Streptomyces sp. NBC_01465 TaxID=2903878 RepID=UPI002E341E29|nr:aldehyde dehydrogenase family protein [Streptomyces sp. NBC_01465]